ncbi:MAG TPA: hypothetical protein VLC49_01350 [Solirubrobacteraceae bacterium]|nr:hypothetical protein [Solirubrobacteraceae bacterium]
MRWRVVALLALSGMVAVPAASVGAQPRSTGAVSVSVKPRTGSARTHFAVSFRAMVTTGRSFHNLYRITADDGTHTGCQSAVGMTAPPTRAGSTVRVVLAPSGSKRWCAGTFHGQVWDVIVQSCLPGKACPAIAPLPHQVGKFTFRVTHG